QVKKPIALAGRGIGAYARMEAAAEDVRKTLSRAQRPQSTPRRTVREFAALVLGRAPGPLSTGTIAVRMQQLGYQSRSQQPHRYMAWVLHSCPRLFEQVAGGRWRLRPAAGRFER